ncbi:MAG TPA: response regulator [Bacteroidia bacterium]|jgi:CheY-like chemotaxis protein
MNNTILLIEDNADMRENINRLLELSGYRILIANNGKEGIELARKHKPDLILCDIVMPDLDGYGVLHALENIPEMIGIPFIFLTAKMETEDFRRGMDLGADDYLTKPFSGDDLLKMVGTRLKKRRMIKETFENSFKELNDLIHSENAFKGLDFLPENRIVKKIKKKGFLFMDAEPANFLFLVLSGKIKTYKTNEWGREYITGIFKTADFFGHVALFHGKSHKESAVAIEDSEVVLIPKEEFFKVLHLNNETSLKFIRLLSTSISEAEEKLLKLAYDSARKRVAQALLFISSKYQLEGQEEKTFFLQRENISALAGISPESVSRNLTDFRKEGLIETVQGHIKILDVKKLELIKN